MLKAAEALNCHPDLHARSLVHSTSRTLGILVSNMENAQVVAGADGLEGGRQAARELLASGFRPTAILCVNDIMAVGVLRELLERGIRVPEDVSVTGFDNIRLAEFCSPALTTVHIPRELIGRTMFEQLMEANHGAPSQDAPELAPRETLIDPELVVRESNAVAAKTGVAGLASWRALQKSPAINSRYSVENL